MKGLHFRKQWFSLYSTEFPANLTDIIVSGNKELNLSYSSYLLFREQIANVDKKFVFFKQKTPNQTSCMLFIFQPTIILLIYPVRALNSLIAILAKKISGESGSYSLAQSL